MNKTCIVVADAGLARIYEVEEGGPSRLSMDLVERAALTNETDLKVLGESATGKVRTETNTNRGSGPVHPMGAQRERHRVELQRRFALEVARRAGEVTGKWKNGTVVFVSEPRFLGLAREYLRQALPREVEMKELARDYAHLAPTELYDQLVGNGLLPAARR